VHFSADGYRGVAPTHDSGAEERPSRGSKFLPDDERHARLIQTVDTVTRMSRGNRDCKTRFLGDVVVELSFLSFGTVPRLLVHDYLPTYFLQRADKEPPLRS
jgi:hypothetical protein